MGQVGKMEKTIKQIADELGIGKQKVYRYIKKNCINEAHQKNGVMYYDDVGQTLIKKGFINVESHHDVHQNHINETANDVLIKMLEKQLEIKDIQINELNNCLHEVTTALIEAQKTTKAAQTLHAADTIGLNEPAADEVYEESRKRKKTWRSIFKK